MNQRIRTKKQEVIRFVGAVIVTGFFFGIGLAAGMAAFRTVTPYAEPAIAYVLPDNNPGWEAE